ncbi:MAG: molybdopterin-guanine dinucleotide biosynthesis protein A [Alphaproteobacteria bacterium]|jgi:hypothetical protein|nr:molybdopterin-guanine dinucleotide biosynthesis protein A [Alphaproteobacteria bacterium]MDP6256200.1 molybdopterin-guanine dinucleotide biosynthesis protein A [Alphaproteobacteria bacterium]MDP7459244.1 molybdopterin-guanine dinucleotide biosynthesis protein A [Alphaproteobacteria bacterium]HJM90572.1 molybdopterin-guanine dinucleotide biosynthesis protein A [Alphaproteobacteria bacterium]|tara:strand:+ start:98 stop:607 length:510 start_codon:yes stop_codon:yes gene_type:complete
MLPRKLSTVLLFVVLLFVLLLGPILTVSSRAIAGDRHAGYYYPLVSSQENYQARSRVMENVGRETRIGFIVAQMNGQRQLHYPPRFAILAKGREAEKLVIVGLDEHSFATLYRARAVLAQLTASARGSALFRDMAVEDLFTFFDLAKMLGFKQITVSDGKNYAHRIDLK